jgi:hypothetical protein
MVAYSFRPRFAEPILDGRKGGTIRADRRRHARSGEQIYVGMRTKQCRLITRKICVAIDPISLDLVARGVEWPADDRLVYRAPDLGAFSEFDGFSSFSEIVDFWPETHAAEKSHGWHIRWAALAANEVDMIDWRANMCLR